MANIVFPYMDLPENAQKEVLRTMDHKDLSAFSTLSRKSRNLVASLNIPAIHLRVTVRDSLLIEMKFPERQYLNLEVNPAKWSYLYGKIQLYSNRTSTTTWRNPGISFRELIRHLCFIFNFSTPSMLVFWSGDEIFGTKSAWNSLSGVLDYLIVSHDNSEQFAQKILRLCLPTSKKLMLYRSTPLIGPILFRHVSIQNLDALHFVYPAQLTLDDLLFCNSSVICAVYNEIAQKTIKGGVH